MVGRNTSGYLTIHLLRPGAIDIMRTQPGFYMTDRNLLIECGKRRSGGGSGISMYQHHIRLHLFQHIPHTEKHTRGYVVQILIRLHDVQIIIRLYIKDMKHLIEHLPMLRCNANNCLELLRFTL